MNTENLEAKTEYDDSFLKKALEYDENYVGDNMSLLNKDLSPYSPLSAAEQKKILTAIRNGDDSRKEELILTNMRLVMAVASKYVRFLSEIWEMGDIVSEGTIGLMRAIDNYDVDKIDEVNFSTYAVFWIKQAITRFMDNNNLDIRVPVHTLSKYRKAIKMASAGGISKEEALKATKIDSYTSALVDNISSMTSLDKFISNGEDDDTTLGEFVPDSSKTIEELSIEKDYIRSIMKIMDEKLDERTSTVIKMRTGIATGDPMSLESIGSEFDISRERVRQIEKKGLQLLREQKKIIV